MNEEMAASTSRAMSSTQCATTPSLHALHNTPMKLLFVRVALRLRSLSVCEVAHTPPRLASTLTYLPCRPFGSQQVEVRAAVEAVARMRMAQPMRPRPRRGGRHARRRL